MASVVLINARAGAVFTQRIRIRDRLRARLGAFRLDRAIAAGAAPDTDAALTLRAEKLLDERTRRQLGSALWKASTQVDPRPIGTRVSPSRRALLDASDLLNRLALRLLAPAPVEARGVAHARLLLSDGSGPLFWSRRSAQLRERAWRALEELEPQTQS
jgi:hypothetical protein